VRGDLFEHIAQLAKVYRFGQVIIEPCFATASEIFIFSMCGERHSRKILSPLGFSNHVAAAPVWQGEVAYDGIKMLGFYKCYCALDRIGRRDRMAKVAEQASEDATRVSVIFDNQNFQGYTHWKTRREFKFPSLKDRNEECLWSPDLRRNFFGRFDSPATIALRLAANVGSAERRAAHRAR
jgi:hypothetical protein